MGTVSTIKQLFQLQELDNEIDSHEAELKSLTAQLGESQALKAARDKVAQASKHLEAVKKQQHDLESDIDDLASRIAPLDKDLYSGRIRNPKELSSLQQEVQDLKKKQSSLEDKELALMEQLESGTSTLAKLTGELHSVEAEWHVQQKDLSSHIEQVKTALSELKTKRQSLSKLVEPGTLELYRQLRKQKAQAVARVVQGICRGCRISLPGAELQRARSGSLVQCSSCNRILFLD